MDNTTQAIQRLKGEALALATLIEYSKQGDAAAFRQMQAHAQILRRVVGAVNEAQDREAFGA